MNYLQFIKQDLQNSVTPKDLIRKTYLTYPAAALLGYENQQYEILKEISKNFEIPISSIQIAGSAKIGYSLHKDREFNQGQSDLDIAIIDQNLFVKYMEKIFSETRAYSNRSRFPLNKDGVSRADEFISYLSRGIFNAKAMPSGETRKQWNKFFGMLSKKHSNIFKHINAVIYLSEEFFEVKQLSALKVYREREGI
ncbi:hypothetical protein Q666_04970 [Marinobacter sp. ES-1]|uniref:Uncharacterized protein n=1 Tax=Marinobacter vinifirmus TaxID=355591 RepID=A0A558B6R4_9GAMM|nr:MULTISPECIES: hypothetical protein [Marinobacter]ERP96355.1 hypothetical protein Q666_04970 [Marinobacter sp. ES-1]TVT32204.1 MAG: hypothetical protein FHK81_13165 [Marinobacter vinifirmus]